MKKLKRDQEDFYSIIYTLRAQIDLFKDQSESKKNRLSPNTRKLFDIASKTVTEIVKQKCPDPLEYPSFEFIDRCLNYCRLDVIICKDGNESKMEQDRLRQIVFIFNLSSIMLYDLYDRFESVFKISEQVNRVQTRKKGYWKDTASYTPIEDCVCEVMQIGEDAHIAHSILRYWIQNRGEKYKEEFMPLLEITKTQFDNSVETVKKLLPLALNHYTSRSKYAPVL